jgi:hypothetical protein
LNGAIAGAACPKRDSRATWRKARQQGDIQGRVLILDLKMCYDQPSTHMEGKMNLSAPTTAVFIISVIIAIIALLIFVHVIPFAAIPAFWILAIAYIVLLAGNLFAGL